MLNISNSHVYTDVWDAD